MVVKPIGIKHQTKHKHNFQKSWNGWFLASPELVVAVDGVGFSALLFVFPFGFEVFDCSLFVVFPNLFIFVLVCYLLDSFSLVL